MLYLSYEQDKRLRSKTLIISINISEEQIKRAEQIAKQRRMSTGEQANRSSEIGRAIDALFLIECPSDRTDLITKDEPVAA